MEEEKTKQISQIKEKMVGLDSESPYYKHYQSLLLELEQKIVPKLKIHSVPEICESCQ